MSERKVFRTLVSIEEAWNRLYQHFTPQPLGVEEVPLLQSAGRVLGEDIVSPIDVPGFDRASMDGYAVKAEDTFGADDENPVALKIVGRVEAGEKPDIEVREREAVEIATGAPIPTGAGAVVMVEYTHRVNDTLQVYRAVVPGENVMAAGVDIMAGELILRRGELITPREMGVLSALGVTSVTVYRRPRVAILSTGNELLTPGHPLEYGKIYDINASALAGVVAECGGEPFDFGIAPDDPQKMREKIESALKSSDLVLTSGSTSAGVGDLVYRIIDGLGKPGVLAHGVSVKPGKPTIVAVANGKPIFGLPGYPTSALMMYHAMVAPVVRSMSGLSSREPSRLEARVAFRVFSAKGRRELLPVHLTKDEAGNHLAYPAVGGSGAITSFSLSDGFIDIPESVEFLEEGEKAQVTLFGAELRPTDLVMIGSHCVGVDILVHCVREGDQSFRAKIINVGSFGGLHSVKRGEADVAGIHILDEESGEFNIPFIYRFKLKGKAALVRGYNREQGLIVPKGNPKSVRTFEDVLSGGLRFINRNAGSGTRLLVDLHLKKLALDRGIKPEDIHSKIKGYQVEAKSHTAVAAAVLHGRADVGVGIRTVAESSGLGFIKLCDERYDFLIPKARLKKKGVQQFLEALRSERFRSALAREAPGLVPSDETGKIIVS